MDAMLNNIVAIVSVTLALIVLFQKRLRTSPTWHATVTPLASIIGSGFLVSAPLLLLSAGKWAFLVMSAIVLIAYAVGASLRFNIQHIESGLSGYSDRMWIRQVEGLSRPVLGIAYIISVCFYLKLLSAFALRGIAIGHPFYQNGLTTALLIFIGVIGKVRGLSMLEILETYSVSAKLAIIFTLIVTHFFYNAELIANGQWVLKVYPHETGWTGFRKILGMLIIIQGFETSRYLGYAYDSATRIQTMRYAQWISGAIYVLFLALAMVVFNDVNAITETTAIDLCQVIAPILPYLLIIAAILSQFSAAVADTIGSGGLLAEAFNRKISVNNCYMLIMLAALILTWVTNIYEIITIASKAFALYYALQIVITLLVLKFSYGNIMKSMAYSLLLALMLVTVFFGIPVE